MKKRVIGMLLCFCMVTALLCGMSGMAYADNTVEYTLKAGDTVIGVCQKLGIDFYANQAWIMQKNNIANFNNMKVGTKLVLPAASAKDNTGTAAAGKGASTAAGDAVSYYLIEHVMAAGETVYSVCNQLGVDFAANSDKIKAINGISNYNKVSVGAKVLLPSAKAPTSGTYSQIVAHTVVAGDTVGALCRTYGIDYAANMDAIKALSGIDNLGVIKAGQTIYLPVKASVSATSPATAKTDTSKKTDTSTKTDATSTKPAAATTTKPAAATTTPVNTKAQAGAFMVHTSSNGVFHLEVNGQIVNSAKAGETVKVVTVPDQGYKVNEIVVYKTSTTDRIEVKKSTFTMPDHDITIYVTFKAN